MFHIFRSLVPLHNPLGFGLSDLLALGLTLMALIIVFGHAYLGSWFSQIAKRTTWFCIALFLLPIAFRLALLPRVPVPVAASSEDFSSLLLSDTLLHGRLENPPHALPAFFEAPLTLQRPSYKSTLPFWDGVLPAAGQLLFREHWAGILLGIGALSALSYWMLRGWTTPGWALCGGIVVACAFGPLCRWTNCYWGGFISVLAACGIIGALPRLTRYKPGTPQLSLALMFVVAWIYSAHFLFWYSMYAFAAPADLNAALPYAGQDFLNTPGEETHRAVDEELERQPGMQLVFVRRDAWHNSGEWVYNSADIDASKIVWAHDLGEQNNRKLLDYYPGRKAWLLEPDAIPPRLRPYRAAVVNSQ